MVYVCDMQGRMVALWQQKGTVAAAAAGGSWHGYPLWLRIDTRAIPSPDGRYLALLGWTEDRNLWMLENF
jgi:hypothetical protein